MDMTLLRILAQIELVALVIISGFVFFESVKLYRQIRYGTSKLSKQFKMIILTTAFSAVVLTFVGLFGIFRQAGFFSLTQALIVYDILVMAIVIKSIGFAYFIRKFYQVTNEVDAAQSGEKGYDEWR